MRDYIDHIFSETSKVSKKRERIQADSYYEKEKLAPFKAPKWTVDGYHGTLKNLVEAACRERFSKSDTEIVPSDRPFDTHVDEN